MIHQGGYTPKSTQVSRTVKSQGRACCGFMSLSACLLLFLLLFPSTPSLLFSLIFFSAVLSHQHESGAPGVQSPANCSLLCLPHLQLSHYGDWCLGVPACSWYFLSSFLHFLSSHPSIMLNATIKVDKRLQEPKSEWKVCVLHATYMTDYMLAFNEAI